MLKILTLLAATVCMVVATMVVEAVPPGKTIEWDGGGAGKVAFDGLIHSKAEVKCNSCHPKLFLMKRGGNEITMKAINGGDLCGKCHNGQKAFSAKECAKCHQK